MKSKIDILYQKLGEFITKFHLYKMIKGFLFFLALFILVFISQSLIEYFNYLRVGIKTALFYTTLIASLFLIIYYFLMPLASLLKIRNRISYKQAATIISNHFPEVKDRLINTLELEDIIKTNPENCDLFIASINQRIDNLSPLPFKNAINFERLKNALLFFGFSIFIFLSIFSINPKVITEGTVRFINYSKYYEPKAPFSFVLEDKYMKCEKNKDFTINLKVEGEYIPDNVYIKISGNLFLMNKEKIAGHYNFTLRNINTNVDFSFSADKYYSKSYLLEVLPAPLLRSLLLEIVPPSNTGIETFKIQNTGDCNIPSGSVVNWTIATTYVDTLKFVFDKDSINLVKEDQLFNLKRQVKQNVHYSISMKNKYFATDNGLKYNITTIADEFPEIEIKQVEDSVLIGAYYYMISIKDDYGFRDLKFVGRLVKEDSIKNVFEEQILINNVLRLQDLFYYFDFNSLKDIPDGSVLEYYFEIRDNDYLNGYKAARTAAKIYKLPTKEDIRKEISEIDQDRDNNLSKSKKLTDEIKNNIEELKRKELNNELSEWEKKNFLKNIVDKQKQLDEVIKDALEKNQKGNQLNNQFYEEQKNIIEKQKQIQELLDQILDDELKKLLEEIQKLSEKFDQKQFDKLRDKLDLSYKNLEKKLDRSLEMLKRYQVEENVNRISEELKELSKEQKELSEKSPELKKSEELIEKQNQIKNEFENLKKDYENTLDLDKNLKSPYQIDKFDENFNEIQKEQDQLKEDIPSGSKNKIKKQQQKVSEDMQNLAEKMEGMVNQMEMQTIEMNIEDLRQIIDNLSIFSENQEDNYTNTNKNLPNSPAFPGLIVNQAKLSDDFEIIEDSLQSVMDKVPQMGQLIYKETEDILYNLGKAKSLMEQRNRKDALKIQRYILNSGNTLALYLDEIKNQMENMKQSGSGGKPKKNKPSDAMQNLKQQQQNLKEQLEKLLNEMKKEGGKDGKEMKDQLVKTLAEQEIFNNMLQQMQNEKGMSPEVSKKLKEIKKLSDENIEDLINKNISPELQNRNQKILSRLLESEKSEREREQEKKRESREGNKKDIVIPEELKESLKKDKQYKESLQKLNLNMKNYYKNIIEDYFRLISK